MNSPFSQGTAADLKASLSRQIAPAFVTAVNLGHTMFAGQAYIVPAFFFLWVN